MNKVITDELDVSKDYELIWGLKYYGRNMRERDASELGMGSLMLRAANRIKELSVENGAKMVCRSGVIDDEGIFHPINGINGEPYYLCPKCDMNLCADGPLGRDRKKMKYCNNCGQKLDWSE